jgi:uncharacterized protein (TIGR02284 family)
MADVQRELSKVLRDLASTCRDAEEGYNKAAKGAHSDEIRALFDRYSKERAGFAAEYDGFIRAQGEEPGDTGHGGGPLRRGWVDLEARLRPRDDAEIASLAADGDERGLNHFESALSLQGLTPDVRQTVIRHMAAIRARVESLRRAPV